MILAKTDWLNGGSAAEDGEPLIVRIVQNPRGLGTVSDTEIELYYWR